MQTNINVVINNVFNLDLVYKMLKNYNLFIVKYFFKIGNK